MDKDKIPYIAFEAEMARHERTIKRLLIALFDIEGEAVQQEKLFKHL